MANARELQANDPQVNEPQTVRIKMFPALTADENRRNIIANIVIEGQSVPYIDDADNGSSKTSADQQILNNVPHLRYYAVGPGTCKIKCPLCDQQANAAVLHLPSWIKDITCCLSILSCCFPIFWLCCLSAAVIVSANRRLFIATSVVANWARSSK